MNKIYSNGNRQTELTLSITNEIQGIQKKKIEYNNNIVIA